MFGLILAGYLMSGSHGGEHNMPQDWRPLPKNWLLWYNSGILVLNSLAWHWALTAARQGNARVLQRALAMAGALGFVFLLGQLAVRSEEHTSELQSLMRISYAVFCLKKKNRR